MEESEPIIGIDLGTTNCCVAVMVNDEVKIVHNDDGENITPSFVAFTLKETIVGREAKDLAVLCPENVVYDMKRLIGRSYQDPIVQSDMKRWPFKIVDGDTKPMIQVKIRKEGFFSAEAISALLLEKLKKHAENFLGKPVKSAVITIPARFNMSQKQATIDAGKMAGLEVKHLMVEPTAAALAYGVQKKLGKKDSKVLVFDLGGGTLDVSIMQIKDENFEVLVTEGNPHLGGEDFDNRLVDYFVEQFRKMTNVDPGKEVKAIRRLKTKCELVKKRLSFVDEGNISLDAFFQNTDFHSTIKREEFELINEDLFTQTINYVSSALHAANLTVDDIDEVVLVGGSTRIPKIQSLLSNFFNGKPLNKQLHPDEAVAYGAAIKADQMREISPTKHQIHHQDLTPFSIGIKDANGQFVKLIPKNSKYPIKGVQTWYTALDYQDSFNFSLYEGERPLGDDNHYLGKFAIRNIPRKLAGEVVATTTMEIDENGILKVTGVEESTKNSYELVITFDQDRFSNEETDRMIKEAEISKEEDEKKKSLYVAKTKLECLCLNALSRINDAKFNKKIKDKDKKNIANISRINLAWLNVYQASLEQYYEKIDELENLCKKLDLKAQG